MACITPSNPTPIPPGESFDIYQTSHKTLGVLGNAEAYTDSLDTLLKRTLESLESLGFDSTEAQSHLESLLTPPPISEPTPTLLQPPSTDSRPFSDSRLDVFSRTVLLPSPAPIEGTEMHPMTLRDMYWLAAQDAKDANELSKVVGRYRSSVYRAFKERLAALGGEAVVEGSKKKKKEKEEKKDAEYVGE
jgi:hypothetical protein